MRVFFALVINEKSKKRIYQLQTEKLKECGGKFTESSNFHLTLVFVGEVEKEKIKSLLDIANDENISSFSMMGKHIDCFQKKKKIIWIGVETPTLIEEYVKRIEEKVRLLGFSIEKREYIPHVTLMRGATTLPQNTDASVLIEFERLALMESVNIDEKLIYREVPYEK